MRIPRLQTLVLVLRSAGFRAGGGVSAATALQTAELQCPDILLCDIRLGNANGVELSLDIHNLLPDCRIILMSGDTMPAKILANAHARGRDFEVLAKAMSPEELLRSVGVTTDTTAAGSALAPRCRYFF
jgi:DNA-binding NtrC family response regulator